MSSLRMSFWVVVLSAVVLLLSAQTTSQTGSISGIVTDESAAPVARATVVYNSVRSSVRDSSGHLRPTGPLLSAIVRTDSDGSFVISGVPEGEYYLCAIGIVASHLRSCEWDGDYALTPVNAGRTTTRNLRLRTGALVNLSVSDPNGRITASGNRSFLPSVISQTGEVKPFTLMSSTATARSYRVAVPRGATAYVVFDTQFSITDSNAQVVRTRVAAIRVSLADSTETTVTVNVQ